MWGLQRKKSVTSQTVKKDKSHNGNAGDVCADIRSAPAMAKIGGATCTHKSLASEDQEGKETGYDLTC